MNFIFQVRFAKGCVWYLRKWTICNVKTLPKQETNRNIWQIFGFAFGHMLHWHQQLTVSKYLNGRVNLQDLTTDEEKGVRSLTDMSFMQVSAS
jgi:hypothetical protein